MIYDSQTVGADNEGFNVIESGLMFFRPGEVRLSILLHKRCQDMGIVSQFWQEHSNIMDEAQKSTDTG